MIIILFTTHNLTTTIDIRVMMTVMLLLALVFAAFGGLLLHVRAAQVNSDRTQADLFTLPHLQESTRRYEHSKILL